MKKHKQKNSKKKNQKYVLFEYYSSPRDFLLLILGLSEFII